MPSLIDLLGDRLINSADGEINTTDLQTDGQIVGIYFSALWCPPCVGFTPKLVEFYNHMLSAKTEKQIQIVFVSSDKDDDQFMEHFSSMPWLALPYQDRDRKARLSKKFKVHAIPVLVLLNGKTGEVISTEGRNNVLDDPEGTDFPWYPKPLDTILNGTVKCVTGDLDAGLNLKGKVKGIFFSAHWCPPCRVFTPVLIEVYKKLREAGKNFEVLFVSSDRTEESYDDYFSTMPWLALPYGDDRVKEVTKHFGVQGIPTLVIVNEQNEIISTNGRAVISKDPEGQDFPWLPKPLEELSQITMPILNQAPCLVFFTDGEADLIVQAKSVMKNVACKYTEMQKASVDTDHEKPELFFMYEGNHEESGEMGDTLRNLIQKDEDDTPLLVLFDIPETKFNVHESDVITQDSVQKLIDNFTEGTLNFEAMNGT